VSSKLHYSVVQASNLPPRRARWSRGHRLRRTPDHPWKMRGSCETSRVTSRLPPVISGPLGERCGFSALRFRSRGLCHGRALAPCGLAAIDSRAAASSQILNSGATAPIARVVVDENAGSPLARRFELGHRHGSGQIDRSMSRTLAKVQHHESLSAQFRSQVERAAGPHSARPRHRSKAAR